MDGDGNQPSQPIDHPEHKTHKAALVFLVIAGLLLLGAIFSRSLFTGERGGGPSSGSNLSPEEQQRILESLQGATPSSNYSPEEQARILESLESTAPASNYSPEEQARILDSL